jgi:hypothetical protein
LTQTCGSAKKKNRFPVSPAVRHLKGDNWPDSANRPAIRNLLLHRIDCDCWTLEVHLKDFVPAQNWQQAGILLMEDTGFKGSSLRLSIAFNDYNGVYPRSGSVILQAVISRGTGEDKPEELAHSSGAVPARFTYFRLECCKRR